MTDRIESAVAQMLSWAESPEHGYDQSGRWGPDYDCSSAVIQAWENAGVPVKSRGATYTGNMYQVFGGCGFEDVTPRINLNSVAGLLRGDVLLNHRKHTAVYTGGGQLVEARINELGTVTGGKSGDQTGREFCVSAYRNHPWDCVLRYSGGRADPAQSPGGTGPTYYYNVRLPLLKPGMADGAVSALQVLLHGEGLYAGDFDGIFGPGTEAALRQFQRDAGLEADGEAGGQSWKKLLGG